MTTLSLERVDVLTGNVENLSRNAQLSSSLAKIANKDFVDVTTVDAQNIFLQTVLALQKEGKVEKNFLLWLASCLKHEAFIVFAESDVLPALLELWLSRSSLALPQTQLAQQLAPALSDSFTEHVLTIAAIAHRMPSIDKTFLINFFYTILRREKATVKGKHLLMSRAVLLMEFAQDLWLKYGVELRISSFISAWLNLSEGRTAAIERTVFHLLRYNNAITSKVLHQIVHVLILITLEVKEMQVDVFKHKNSKNVWFSSEELEQILTDFILDDNFMLLASKVSVLDFERNVIKSDRQKNRIDQLFSHWVHSNQLEKKDRLRSYNHCNISFEQLVKYTPPFAFFTQGYSYSDTDWSKNIRTIYPFLTPKEAHIFSNHEYVDLRGHCGQNEENHFYIWSAKVKNLGGNSDLALAIYQFKRQNFEDLAFWDAVLRFCVANEPVLQRFYQEHTNTYSQLFGYLAHKRQEEGNRFDMKGRSLRAVMDQAENWYAQLRQTYRNTHRPDLKWNGAAYKPYELIENDSVYTITQLTDSAALREESNILNHCVWTYDEKCAFGSCSIWSLRISINAFNAKPIATIEVDLQNRIVQAKSVRNAQPNTHHLAIIKEWAAREGIVFVRC
jgi:PcfJ-like protein